MKQDLLYIATELKKLDPDLRYFLMNMDASKINLPKLTRTLPKQWRKDVLYLVQSSALPPEKPEQLPPNLLCWQDEPAPGWLQQNCGSNVVLTNREMTEKQLRDVIFLMGGIQKRFDVASDRILEALYYGQGLQALVDIASELLENTVAILDTNWKLLAHSRVYPVVHPTMQAALKSGYLDSAVVERMKEDGLFEQLRRNGKMIIFPMTEEDPSCHGICWCYIRVNGTVSGYFVVYGDRAPIAEYYPDIIMRLARFASMELQKERGSAPDQDAAYEALMLDLLEERITDQLVILRRLRLLDQKLEPRLHVITIRKMSAKAQIALSAVERERLRDFFPGCLAVSYERGFVLLVSSADGSIPVQEDMEALNREFQVNSLSAGVSNEFTNLAELSRYYRQSTKALEFGWSIASKGGLFHYTDYAIYHALELCTKHVDLRDLCHPGILKLQESTDPGDQDLFQTLYLYLLYMKDVNRVSNRLNIHRSTLFYRLNKIKAITGVDLDDGNVISHLLFSYKLIEYMDIFTPSDRMLKKKEK